MTKDNKCQICIGKYIQKLARKRITKPSAKVISFGWNTAGIGKQYGFEITRIRLVAHGSQHNDTICTVEIKRQSTLDAQQDNSSEGVR